MNAFLNGKAVGVARDAVKDKVMASVAPNTTGFHVRKTTDQHCQASLHSCAENGVKKFNPRPRFQGVTDQGSELAVFKS